MLLEPETGKMGLLLSPNLGARFQGVEGAPTMCSILATRIFIT